MRPTISLIRIVASVALIFGGAVGATETGAPLNFVPVLNLGYTDPATGETVECGADCRRFKVPEGVILDVAVRVEDGDGSVTGDEVVWDLWFNQPLHPFPGVHIEDCRAGEIGEIDVECWRAMAERVNWEDWNHLSADRVCVPSGSSTCRDQKIQIPMDAAFEGARRPGTYHIALWIDRYHVSADENEFDNFLGPIRVTVVPRIDGVGSDQISPAEQAASNLQDSQSIIVDVATPKPWTVIIAQQETEIGFVLSSDRSRGILQFEPSYPGPVEIEVEQVSNPHMLYVEFRKVSTGEVLVDIRDRGRIQINGTITRDMLKNDRRLEVVVKSTARPQGLRGIIRVRYPHRALYRPAD